jgi:hypothetical protein
MNFSDSYRGAFLGVQQEVANLMIRQADQEISQRQQAAMAELESIRERQKDLSEKAVELLDPKEANRYLEKRSEFYMDRAKANRRTQYSSTTYSEGGKPEKEPKAIRVDPGIYKHEEDGRVTALMEHAETGDYDAALAFIGSNEKFAATRTTSPEQALVNGAGAINILRGGLAAQGITTVEDQQPYLVQAAAAISQASGGPEANNRPRFTPQQILQKAAQSFDPESNTGTAGVNAKVSYTHGESGPSSIIDIDYHDYIPPSAQAQRIEDEMSNLQLMEQRARAELANIPTTMEMAGRSFAKYAPSSASLSGMPASPYAKAVSSAFGKAYYYAENARDPRELVPAAFKDVDISSLVVDPAGKSDEELVAETKQRVSATGATGEDAKKLQEAALTMSLTPAAEGELNAEEENVSEPQQLTNPWLDVYDRGIQERKAIEQQELDKLQAHEEQRKRLAQHHENQEAARNAELLQEQERQRQILYETGQLADDYGSFHPDPYPQNLYQSLPSVPGPRGRVTDPFGDFLQSDTD